MISLQVHVRFGRHSLHLDVYRTPVHAREPTMAGLSWAQGEGKTGVENDSTSRESGRGTGDHTRGF